MKSFIAKALVGALAAFTLAGGAVAEEKVSFTLNWTADPGHAPYFYGQSLGLYKDQGIKLKIFQGRGSGNTSQLVAAGRTDIGIVDTASAINLAARGAPLKIIGVIEHVSGWALMVKEGSSIKSPKDLEGKTMGISSGTAQKALFNALAAANDIDMSKVKITNYDNAAALSMLSEERVDAIIEVPDIMKPRLDERGVPSRSLYLRDFGVPLFGISIIASEDTLAKRPDMVRGFLKATAESLHSTVKDREAAVDVLLQRYPDAGEREAALHTVNSRADSLYCAKDSLGLLQPSEANLNGAFKVMTTYMGVDASKPIDFYYVGDFLPNPPVPCKD